MSASGTDSKMVIDNAGQNLAWSPDGSQLAFLKGRLVKTGNTGIFKTSVAVIRADSTAERTIVDDPKYLDMTPAWSPDGRWIAFSRINLVTNERSLWLVNPNGNGLHLILKQQSRPGKLLGDPAWSPDGKRIAYTGGTDQHEDIFLTNPDGTSVTQLTTNAAPDPDPTWSPDGRYIAFSSSAISTRRST